MSTTTTTQAETQNPGESLTDEERAQLKEHTDQLAAQPAPVRATWKQHGNPQSGFDFYGVLTEHPEEHAIRIVKVDTTEKGVIVLKAGNGRAARNGKFGVATKFWAIVPDEAKAAKPEPKAKADKLAPVEITAPKGGDQTVPPVKGAIAKAIKDSGETVLGISRKHGLNPAQMRRLTLDQVAKVDRVRAEAIAKALGRPMADLFGEATAKGKAKPADPKPATETAPKPATTGKGKGKNRTARASAKADQDAAGRQAPETVTTTEPAATEPAATTPAE